MPNLKIKKHSHVEDWDWMPLFLLVEESTRDTCHTKGGVQDMLEFFCFLEGSRAS